MYPFSSPTHLAQKARLRLAAIAVALALLACNMPRLALPSPTPTISPRPILPSLSPSKTPTSSLPPPVEMTPLPTPGASASAPVLDEPTPAALPPEPSAAPELTVQAVTEPPPPTIGPSVTPGFPIPDDRSLFEGVFEGGRLSFRIGANSLTVIPKTLILKGAACKEGGKANDSIVFEPPPEFPIERGRFTVNYDGMAIIFGQFQSRDRVIGNVTVKLFLTDGACTVGPLPFAAASP